MHFPTCCTQLWTVTLDIEIPLETAFSGVDLGKKADFAVAVSRFRLKAKPQRLVKRMLDSVSASILFFYVEMKPEN